MLKSALLSLSFLLLHFMAWGQRVGIGTNVPDPSAVLEIKSANSGLLIPRMSASQMNAIASPAKGLMILDTMNNQLMINMGTSLIPNWQSVVTGSGWSLNGNSGTNPSINFIGTTDDKPIAFRRNNNPAGKIDAYGDIAFGNSALQQLTIGNHNIAIGEEALYSDTSGFGNVAIGSYALNLNRSGFSNIAIGADACLLNRTGDRNTAIGSGALLSNKYGTSNVAIGVDALYSDTLADFCVAIGDNALFNQLGSPGLNTAVGSKSMYYNTTGYANTGVGNHTLYSNTIGSGNCAFGDESLFNNTTGWFNAAFGNYSLHNNTEGYYNTAIGIGAMQLNTSGSNNTSVGYYSLLYNNTGSGNTAIGNASLVSNSTGSYNVAIGNQAMLSHQSGDLNVAIGGEALREDISGIGNVAVGYDAAHYNKTGNYNVALGLDALAGHKSGDANVAIGTNAQYLDTTGIYNVSIGYSALFSNRSGAFNVAIGQDAGKNSLGYANTMIGASTNLSDQAGFNLTILGAGADVTTNNLSGATAVGAGAKVGCSNCMSLGANNNGSLNTLVGIGTSNPTAILDVRKVSAGPTVANFKGTDYQSTFMYGSNEDTYLNGGKNNSNVILSNIPGGRVGIRTETPGAVFAVHKAGGTETVMDIKGTSVFSHFMYGAGEDTYIRGGLTNSLVIIGDLNNSVVIGPGPHFVNYFLTTNGNTYNNGNTYVAGNLCAVGSIGACSDVRYKTDIKPIERAMSFIDQLQPIYYYWKQHEYPDKHFNNRRQLGLSAQAVEKVIPEIVDTQADGYKSIDYSRLTPVLVRALQEQQKTIDELKAENQNLEARLAVLEKMMRNIIKEPVNSN